MELIYGYPITDNVIENQESNAGVPTTRIIEWVAADLLDSLQQAVTMETKVPWPPVAGKPLGHFADGMAKVDGDTLHLWFEVDGQKGLRATVSLEPATTLEAARMADARQDPVTAINNFEAALQANSVTVEDLLDLAVLYMECGDLGFTSHHRIPKSVEDIAFPRAMEVIALARSRFPESADVEFWGLYIPWAVLGAPWPDEAALLSLVDAGALSPYLCLVQSTGSIEDESGAARLLAAVQHARTTRGRYVRSVLESALRWRQS
jgi:hypothetical protein